MTRLPGWCALAIVAVAAQRSATTPNAVVAADGTGDYTTVQAAIDAVPQNTRAGSRWLIAVRPGTYRERVYVQREKRYVTLVGDDPLRVVIAYNLSAQQAGPDGQPIGTFRTPTATIDADDFTAEKVTFENSAGPVGQALAIRVDGDRAIFRNCRFLGWQDTMLLNRGRQYLEDAYIAGHVDFIFGSATAYFERPRIHVLRSGYITAASTPPDVRFGFVFANGTITGEPGAMTYLGRPWRDFAQVTFLGTEMSDAVVPAGWHNWDRPEREKTTRYGEFGSRGPGAHANERASWAARLSPRNARELSAATVLAGSDGWTPLRVAK
jgi:pectinesterase